MKFIVISSPIFVPNEHGIIHSLFEEGLEFFHLRKPSFSKGETENFIQQISTRYHDRIALHSDYPKFHSLQEIKECKEKYDYAFLSPLFDSISKYGYKSKFSRELHEFSQIKLELIRVISGKNIIALGGIDEDKIAIVRELGFAGVAALGAIWNSKNPIKKFLRIKEKCQKKDLVF